MHKGLLIGGVIGLGALAWWLFGRDDCGCGGGAGDCGCHGASASGTNIISPSMTAGAFVTAGGGTQRGLVAPPASGFAPATQLSTVQSWRNAVALVSASDRALQPVAPAPNTITWQTTGQTGLLGSHRQ